MKHLNRLWRIILIVTILVFIVVTPAFAIVNPDSIDIGYYKVFYDVLSAGDMFFAAEGKVIYAIEPTDYTASQAFLFEVLNAAGTATLASTTLQQYGDRPVGMYFTATQVTSIGFVVGTAYKIRITPNPLLLGTEFGGGGVIEGTNQKTITLGATNYVDQDLGADSGIPSNNNIRNFMIEMATAIEAYDTPVDDYIETIQGYKYLTLAGSDIFLDCIAGLDAICPILFQSGIEVMTGDPQENTGTYALTLTPAQKWGSTAANGLTNIGVYLGINQALAGSVVLCIFAIMLAVFVYAKTESGVTVLLLIATTPFIGAYMGLMPIALAFIFVIVIVVLLGYFFLSRGAL